MDKRIKWDKDYDFAMLSMIKKFTDEELRELGMDDEEIRKFREFEKKYAPDGSSREPDEEHKEE